jgi:hypothetical protein
MNTFKLPHVSKSTEAKTIRITCDIQQVDEGMINRIWTTAVLSEWPKSTLTAFGELTKLT